MQVTMTNNIKLSKFKSIVWPEVLLYIVGSLLDSQSQMFFKIYVIKKFAKLKFCRIHRKTLVLESLFNKIPDPKACNFFMNNSAKFATIPFLQNTSCHLILHWISHFHGLNFRSKFLDQMFLQLTSFLRG